MTVAHDDPGHGQLFLSPEDRDAYRAKEAAQRAAAIAWSNLKSALPWSAPAHLTADEINEIAVKLGAVKQ